MSQISTTVNPGGTAMSATGGETASMNDVAAAAGLSQLGRGTTVTMTKWRLRDELELLRKRRRRG